MQKSFKLLPPVMPNFIKIEGMPNSIIPVNELSESEAKEYAEMMKQAFVDHYYKHKAIHDNSRLVASNRER